VASRHAFEDGAGEVGFISSVSEPFCGDCHRARLSADGQLFTCLFASRGQDLRAAISNGEDALVERIAGLWQGRSDRYSELRGTSVPEPKPGKKIEMYFIGG
jgi:cyclic pyranopterin phosphate synthase